MFTFNMSRILKHSSLQVLIQVITASAPFILIPILTRYLDPEEYGYMVLVTLFILLFRPFMSFGFHSGLKKIYVQKQDDYAEFLSSAIISNLAMAGLLCVLIFLVSLSVDIIWGIPIVWLYGVVVIGLGVNIFEFMTQTMRIDGQILRVGALNIGHVWGYNICAVGLIVLLHFGWEGRILPQIFFAILFQLAFSFSFFLKRSLFTFSFNRTKFKALCILCLPLIPVNLSFYFLMSTDRFFIAEMIDVQTLGIYAVAAQIAALVTLVNDAFMPYWEIWIFSLLKEHGREGSRQTLKLIAIYSGALIFLFLFVLYIVPLGIEFLLGPQYRAAESFLLWLLIAACMRCLFSLFLPLFTRIHKTKILMLIILIVAALNIGLNYVLISYNGAIGAAQGTFASYLIGCFIMSAYLYFAKFSSLAKDLKNAK